MPREGTETFSRRRHISRDIRMHPMPREGTETSFFLRAVFCFLMHPMPREGTETLLFLVLLLRVL